MREGKAKVALSRSPSRNRMFCTGAAAGPVCLQEDYGWMCSRRSALAVGVCLGGWCVFGARGDVCFSAALLWFFCLL